MPKKSIKHTHIYLTEIKNSIRRGKHEKTVFFLLCLRLFFGSCVTTKIVKQKKRTGKINLNKFSMRF